MRRSYILSMKLSDYVIDFLVNQGISHIFELTGGAITHLLDSTYGRDDIECVSVHHEQAGAFAAEGYARMNSNLGVAMATSGPGALNLVTGIGSCYFDSVPCLFITGQVNTYEYKFDQPVRQIGFQETDIVTVVKSITKYAELIINENKIRYCLEKAVFIARSGRPGPVLLDIPMNIQRAQIDPEKLESYFDRNEYKNLQLQNVCSEAQINQVIEKIKQAKRPLILAGGGVRTARAVKELSEFIEKTNVPVVTSLMGLDVISHDNSRFYGMIGSYGNRYSNLVLANCDLLLILGSRLDTRQTGARYDTFARGATKIHIDIDPTELNAKIPVNIAINCDLKQFLKKVNTKFDEVEQKGLSEWYQVIQAYKSNYDDHSRQDAANKLDPNSIMNRLSAQSNEGDIICLDVGQNQMWAAQSFKLKKHQRMLISGGMGAMGFSLPAAIGALKANPGNNAIVLTGDGGIQINIQEFETIRYHNLPIKIFVFNNKCLGMITQFQELYFDGRLQSSVIGYSCPDFAKIAEAYGIPSITITASNNANILINEAFDKKGPVLVNILLEQKTVVTPKLEFNRPIEDMFPLLDRNELKSIMLIDLVDELPHS